MVVTGLYLHWPRNGMAVRGYGYAGADPSKPGDQGPGVVEIPAVRSGVLNLCRCGVILIATLMSLAFPVLGLTLIAVLALDVLVLQNLSRLKQLLS